MNDLWVPRFICCSFRKGTMKQLKLCKLAATRQTGTFGKMLPMTSLINSNTPSNYELGPFSSNKGALIDFLMFTGPTETFLSFRNDK